MPTDTRFLPAAGSLDAEPGVHRLRPDRRVLELTLRLLGIPLLRGRLTVRSAEFSHDSLTAEIDGSSFRSRVPLLSAMVTRELGEVRFTGEEIAEQPSTEFAGRLDFGDSTRDLVLGGELREAGDGCVILWLRGTLPPPRRPLRTAGRIARLLARRPVHVEFAGEFVR
ncbi:hypothetical protein CU254_12165 [Amycolatopsis sp. AA4]|uniref:hypothetical protein n=1 Tax=Actinomycetes TaxID=1760 RepID=UPI0001B55569|nr:MULTISPECIES: hypothetical protein [Actinomycetes]ATY11137.1 hypothetical protein CU254_12165 [Amycolatopsis sp. AA4]EFL06710.1 hypothetical protein SSMG_02381 [Streptomyces sp. AA4]